MLFNIERDEGHQISGYVVPDGFSGTPRIRLFSAGVEVLACSANEPRPALVDAGRHETGLCGFNIGRDHLPDLADLDDLTITEAECGLLIYRRPPARRVERKVLRLETHLISLWNFDKSLRDRVQYHQLGLENFGRETVTQMFLLGGIKSVYLSGRILYKNYAYWIEDGFETTIVLQNPYAELAERLLVLSMMGDEAIKYLGERDASRLAPAISFAASLPFENDRRLKQKLMEMPFDVAALFADPLVRQLTTSVPDDMAANGAVAAALNVLASCRVVGLRQDPDYFIEAMGAWLEIDPGELAPLPHFPRVNPLAQVLKESRAVDMLLERDLEVYSAVQEAYGIMD